MQEKVEAQGKEITEVPAQVFKETAGFPYRFGK
jgi:hypothetical protein